MLHLSVKEKFTYLNYLSVMSAILNNKVRIWIVGQEPTDRYWDIIKKVKSIEFVKTTPEEGITISYSGGDKTGRIDAIYLGELGDNYVDEYSMEHENLYTKDGTFKRKDITIVKVIQPDLITTEYVKTSDSVIAQLIRRVLLERVWNR